MSTIPASDASSLERVPPQNLDAEQCVLGGMLLSRQAITDVTSILKGHEYYRPAHETIHAVIYDLYGRGEPADPITVAAELTRRGEISRMPSGFGHGWRCDSLERGRFRCFGQQILDIWPLFGVARYTL